MCLSYMQPTDGPCVYHTCNLLMDHVFIIHATYWWTMCLSYMQLTDGPCVHHTCSLLMDHVFIIHAAYWWTMCSSYMQLTDETCVYHTEIIVHVVYELFSLRDKYYNISWECAKHYVVIRPEVLISDPFYRCINSTTECDIRVSQIILQEEYFKVHTIFLSQRLVI